MADDERNHGYGWRRCFEENQHLSLWQRLFACAPSVLDYRWRMWDFRAYRSHGGLAERWLGIRGHSPLAFTLPALLLVFLIHGPTLGWRGFGAVALFLAALLVGYLAARWAGPRYLMEIQLLVMTVVVAVVWFWPGAAGALEWGHHLYRHFLVPFFLVFVGVLLLVTGAVSRGIFKGLKAGPRFARFLPHVNLFVPPPRAPEVTGGNLLRSVVRVPVEYPLHLLFLPSLTLLFLPYYFPLKAWAIFLLAVSWLLLSFPGFHGRFDSILPLVRRGFFIGGQLVVSLVVIVLAIGRVFESSYIQTVVESSSWHILASYLAAAYLLFWFAEYWLNRRLLEEMVALLQRPGDLLGQATYDIDPAEPFASTSTISPTGRRVQVHGSGRLVSIGQLRKSKEAFEFYEKKDLFETLIAKASLSAKIGPTARSDETREELGKLVRRVDFYFGFVNLVLVGLAIALGLTLTRLPQQPIAIVSTPEAATGEQPQGVDLAELIWNDASQDKVILLAASGGGTRAALYAYSVLRGLHSIDALDRVVLASGVSGGGAALSYFASRYEELLGDPDAVVWDEFRCDMSRPFIWDVLEGVSEWRVVSGTRSGQLLAESLCRATFGECPRLDGSMIGPEAPAGDGIQRIGELDFMGLILNTSLAGHLNCEECAEELDFAKAVAKSSRRDQTDGSVAGGRLIFSNLDDPTVFPLGRSDTSIPYVVVQDPTVLLPTAAALNANFPPVFSNAPVDRDRTDRYWVTDGGATDNRGLISLLYALRGALEAMPVAPASLPDIHVVMAEASAGSTGYSQDRGIGTKFGAPGKIASGLIGELLQEVTDLYSTKSGGRVHFHDLAMPEFMRIDGGLGTHWMLPRYVHLTDPDPTSTETVTLDSFALRQVIEDLHQPAASAKVGLCEGEKEGWGIRRTRRNLPTIRSWTEDPESQHKKVWQGLVRELESGS